MLLIFFDLGQVQTGEKPKGFWHFLVLDVQLFSHNIYLWTAGDGYFFFVNTVLQWMAAEQVTSVVLDKWAAYC